MDFAIGEDRKKKIKEMSRTSEFGKKRTLAELEHRIQKVYAFLRDMGSTNSEVKPRILSKNEIAKLFFQCYNDSDKNTIDSIILQAINEKDAIFSSNIHKDFPNLFPEKKNRNIGPRALELEGWNI